MNDDLKVIAEVAQHGIPPKKPRAVPSPPPAGVLANYRIDFRASTSGQAQPTVCGRDAGDIMRELYAMTDRWPRRVGGSLFARTADHKPRWIESPESLFAFICSAVGPVEGSSPVEWRSGSGLITKGEFFEFLRAEADHYEAVEFAPHEPPIPGRCYLHPPVESGDGRALQTLLDRYCPSTPVDRDLILAYFLTLVWGGPPGARPAFLFTAEEGDVNGGRGVGKTTIAEHGGALVGGVVQISNQENFEQIKTRLLSKVGRRKRVVLLDNLKTHRFSWGELEGLVTASAVSGKDLYVGEGERPNTIVYSVSLNGVSLSKDMADRTVILKLRRPTFTPSWEEEMAALIDRSRWAILGDLVARLRSPRRELGPVGRWGAWERSVLSRVDDPVACQSAIRGRAESVDEDAEDSERVREVVEKILEDLHQSPTAGYYRFDTPAVVEIVSRARCERSNPTAASGFLKTVVLPELTKLPKNRGRMYWAWSGRETREQRPTLVCFDPERRVWWVGDVPR